MGIASQKAIAGRRNIVLTDMPGETFEGAIMAYSISDSLEKCSGSTEIFVIGRKYLQTVYASCRQTLYNFCT